MFAVSAFVESEMNFAQLSNPHSMDDGMDPDSGEIQGPKNIRRRVYDALNVLMAMNIMVKEKKEIR